MKSGYMASIVLLALVGCASQNTLPSAVFKSTSNFTPVPLIIDRSEAAGSQIASEVTAPIGVWLFSNSENSAGKPDPSVFYKMAEVRAEITRYQRYYNQMWLDEVASWDTTAE